ncbi:MAG: hypothetical protein ABIZ72_05375 [Candidatus Limnocylindrales bacterium]
MCHRSSTSCGTCRHFRGSVAARLGFCGLDRRHVPLAGDEVRACWEDSAAAPPPDPVTPGLLDLLTVATLGEAHGVNATEPSGRLARADLDSRPAALTALSGGRRLWVEVEDARPTSTPTA